MIHPKCYYFLNNMMHYIWNHCYYQKNCIFIYCIIYNFYYICYLTIKYCLLVYIKGLDSSKLKYRPL